MWAEERGKRIAKSLDTCHFFRDLLDRVKPGAVQPLSNQESLRLGSE